MKKNLPHHCVTDKDWYFHVVTLYKHKDLKYRLVDKGKETCMHICFMCQTFKYQSKSHINIFNFFEVQNIHPKNESNFHINISVK